jgi:hypothetical protein
MTRPILTLFAVVLVIACTTEPSGPLSSPSLRIARASATSTISVTSTTPDSAARDTTLDVTINGSGFVSGAVATWLYNGVADPSQVRTNSTRYVTSKKLVANITITSTATIGKWDVQVTAASKGGIGTELFAIKVRGNVDTTPRFNLVFDDSVNVAAPGQPAVIQPALITGDYRSRTGSLPGLKAGEYQGDYCGVVTLFFTGNDGGMNAEIDHGYDPATMDSPCGGVRYLQFFFSGRGAGPLRYGPQSFVHYLGTFAPGESRLMGILFGIQQPGCNGLHFNSQYAPASDARVTRLPDTLTANGYAKRWRVESQGNHLAMCTTFSNKGPVPTGNTFYMPFGYTITEALYPAGKFP